MAKDTTTTPKTRQHRKADQYNDPHHNYRQYWEGREYEHAAEEILAANQPLGPQKTQPTVRAAAARNEAAYCASTV
jgi:hypothetical protein